MREIALLGSLETAQRRGCAWRIKSVRGAKSCTTKTRSTKTRSKGSRIASKAAVAKAAATAKTMACATKWSWT